MKCFAYANYDIPWHAACRGCGDLGYIEMDGGWLQQCDVCNGVGRDMIPWPELFTAGRKFWMTEDDDEDDEYA